MKVFETISPVIIPFLLLLTAIIGLCKKVNIYNAFVSGIGDALKTVLNIFPLVATLMIGIGFFRSSGLLDFFINLINPLFNALNIPGEILPVALLKPVSGSGSIAVLSDVIKNCGPDSKAGIIASVISGSTETTFYTVAVYFGSVGITDTRHTIKCALLADFICVVSGILICSLFLF